MKNQKYQLLIGIPSKEWPFRWKHHFHVWLVDAIIMIVGAWVFLTIGHLIVNVTVALLR